MAKKYSTKFEKPTVHSNPMELPMLDTIPILDATWCGQSLECLKF